MRVLAKNSPRYWPVLLGVILTVSCSGDAMTASEAEEIGATEGAIVGGFDAPPNRWLQTVTLIDTTKQPVPRNPGRHLCGASLIAPGWAMTASHCVHTAYDVLRPASDFLIAANRYDITSTAGETIAVAQIIPHPLWNRAQLHHDIALLRLANAVTNPTLSTLAPSGFTRSLSYGEAAWLVGWGSTESVSPFTPVIAAAKLQEVEIDFLGIGPTCQETTEWLRPDVNYFAADTACYGVAGDYNVDPPAGSCAGDSGGPAFINREGVYFQTGTTSFGAPVCAVAGYPAAYARVDEHIPWIVANAPLTELTIDVTNEVGSLSVTSADDRVTCQALNGTHRCRNVLQNGPITLTKPNNASWQGLCASAGTQNTCSLTLNGGQVEVGVSVQSPTLASISSALLLRDTGGAFATCSGLATSRTITVSDINGVPGLQCPGCSGSNYSFSGSDDTLRLLYAGVHHDGTRNCNSDVRRTIADNLPTVLSNCGSSGQALSHLYRSPDNAPSTISFEQQLGVSGLACNGNQQQDLDPIRRACTAADEVCGKTRSLGLVLPIVVPNASTENVRYPDAGCLKGKLGSFDAPAGSTCFDSGAPPYACPVTQPDGSVTPDPVRKCCMLPTTKRGAPNCLNVADNRTVFTPGNPDTRFMNLAARDAVGGIATDAATGLPITAAYFRLFSERPDACREASSAAQIACIARADSNGIGIY